MQRSVNRIAGRSTDPSRARDMYNKPVDNAPPITPAVTGISFPSPTETRSDRERRIQIPEPSTSARAGHSSSDGSIQPITPTDYESLDQLWSDLRQQKERKMAKETPKIESFGEISHSVDHAIPVPPRPVSPIPDISPKPSLRRQKSIASFRESADGRTVTATFQIPGIKKQDVHVSYQRNRLGVTWETVQVSESEEGGRIERREKYSRTIPLPEGTRFQDVRAAMDRRHLILKYPTIRSANSESR